MWPDFINISVGIIAVIVVFTLIVFIHELWHFLTAKLFWVKVEEFWIWIPPRLMKLFEDKSWTKYTINLLPIWWFVSLKWERYDEESIIWKDSLAWANIIKQMIIVLAWVFMNFLLACIIFTIIFTVWFKPLQVDIKSEYWTQVKLFMWMEERIRTWLIIIEWLKLTPLENSIASKQWIQKNDVLIAINDKKISEPEEMINSVKYFKAPIKFKIKREDEILELLITPDKWKIWSYVWYNITYNNNDFEYKYPFNEALVEWFSEWYNQSLLTTELLYTTFKKLLFPKTAYERTEARENLGWPIALWWFFIDLVNSKAWLMIFAIVWALLSLNLAIFNLLPFPALDWWRFFVMLVNSIVILFFWKRVINWNLESWIHIIWFFILIWLSILVAYSDIIKLIFR